MRLRFEEDLTQAEIAPVLGVSQTQISRRLSAVLGRLRTYLGEDFRDLGGLGARGCCALTRDGSAGDGPLGGGGASVGELAGSYEFLRDVDEFAVAVLGDAA